MLYRGILATSLSGSLDGLIAARNGGGAYFRNRTHPTDPNTSRQIAMRAAIAAAYVDWQGLTTAQRALWESYARTLPRTNRIGDARHHSGWNEYVRAYTYRIYANNFFAVGVTTSLTTIDLPQPTLTGTPPSGTSNIGSNSATVYFNRSPTDEADYDCLTLIELSGVRTSPGVISITPYPNTRNFFKGPWQLAGYSRSGYDPNYVDMTLSRNIAANERLWFRIRLSSAARGLGPIFYGVIDSA